MLPKWSAPSRSGAPRAVPFIILLLLLTHALIACSTQEIEITRLVETEVEVTRVVEQETEVTRLVEQEVTRIVEQMVETIVTATPEEPAPTAAPVDPTVDRVGFPENYQDTFTIFYEFDRPDNKSARAIYANDIAASVTAEALAAASPEPGSAFPYGSILVLEVYRTQRDEDDNVLLDENGRYIRDELFGLFVMRKEPGFGAKYGAARNGEWEYVAYRPDGSILTPPEATFACASCHVEAGQGRDWVFGARRAFGFEPPLPEAIQVSVVDYTFMPQTITVTAGTEVNWLSHDVVFHTVTAGDLFSSVLRPDASSRFTFEEPGTFAYFCAIHPSMTGQVVVTEG